MINTFNNLVVALTVSQSEGKYYILDMIKTHKSKAVGLEQLHLETSSEKAASINKAIILLQNKHILNESSSTLL